MLAVCFLRGLCLAFGVREGSLQACVPSERSGSSLVFMQDLMVAALLKYHSES